MQSAYVPMIGTTVHRRDAITAEFIQSVAFEGPISLAFAFGESPDFEPSFPLPQPDGSVIAGTPEGPGVIPFRLPQESWAWAPRFVQAEEFPFTIAIQAEGDGAGFLFVDAGAPVDYTVTTTEAGMQAPEFTGKGEAGSALLITPMRVSAWLQEDFTEPAGGIRKDAPDPDLSFTFLSVDTTGSARTTVEPSAHSALETPRVQVGSGHVFDPVAPGGSVGFVRVIGLPGVRAPFSENVLVQVVGEFEIRAA